jgi:hypothetical protein
VDNDLEKHTGSFSFYFSSFALFLLGSTRARFGMGEARGVAFPLLDWRGLSWLICGDDWDWQTESYAFF